MKYFVVATQWATKAETQIKVIVGSFDTFVCAEIFRNAYNQHYSANAEIVGSLELLNDYWRDAE